MAAMPVKPTSGTGEGIAAKYILAKTWKLELDRPLRPYVVFVVKLPAAVAYIGNLRRQSPLLFVPRFAAKLPVAPRQRLRWIPAIELHGAAWIAGLLGKPLPGSPAVAALAMFELAFANFGKLVRRNASRLYARGETGIAVLAKVLAERSARPLAPRIAVLPLMPVIRSASSATGFPTECLVGIEIEEFERPLDLTDLADLAGFPKSEVLCLSSHSGCAQAPSAASDSRRYVG